MLIPIILIPILIAMFLAANMGGSGIAPSFSVAYGSNALNKTLIAGLFGTMVFIGTLLTGKETTITVGKGILSPEFMSPIIVSIILLSVAIALFISNLIGVAQSTSQATVFAVMAPAIYFSKLNTHKVFIEIIPAWFILPVVSFIFTFLIAKYIYYPIKENKIFQNLKILNTIIIVSSLYVAFSIGSNNVANAAGPLSSMFNNKVGNNEYDSLFMLLSMIIIAPMFGIGASLLGFKNLNKTGIEIISFNKMEAAIIGFVSATILILASISRGIPTSLVQLNVAGILGIGIANFGFKKIVKKSTVKLFFGLWIISPIFAFILSFGLIYLSDILGYL